MTPAQLDRYVEEIHHLLDGAALNAMVPQWAYARIREILREVEAQEKERCAVVAERRFPRGGAHSYASENADRYRALEDAAEAIAAAIRGTK